MWLKNVLKFFYFGLIYQSKIMLSDLVKYFSRSLKNVESWFSNIYDNALDNEFSKSTVETVE